jgi:uncharacterized protein (DUF1015 family)
MADVRPFRGLRYGPQAGDLARTIAPPYDVITAEQQRALYERSPHNIVRVEYGEERPGDGDADNRYTRAAVDLASWRSGGVLVRDERTAFYIYRQEFQSEGPRVRTTCFVALRLEAWEKGVVKPHEQTFPHHKQDRLALLRATATQVSPVYSVCRDRHGQPCAWPEPDEWLYDFEAEGQQHRLGAVYDPVKQATVVAQLAESDVYIADGHHRYETALAYRDEVRARAAGWAGDEPENFVMMGLTDVADPGLVVLPTHRIIDPPSFPADTLERIGRAFAVDDVTPKSWDGTGLLRLLARLEAAKRSGTAFATVGLEQNRLHLLTLTDRAAVEALMPPGQPESWRRLDVNVLQFGILQPVLGINDDVLAGGSAVTYTQDAREAQAAVESGRARVAFLLNATPVEQVLAVADAGGRMPQKSTYFYPKLPTGLVMYPFEP